MSSPDVIVGLSVVLAILFVTWRWRTRPGKQTLDWIIPGQFKFDAKSSWLSNASLFSAILTTALKDFKLEEPKKLFEAVEISNLNILFLGLAALALLVSAASVRQSGKTTGTPIRLYLVSAFLALWAAAGQLLTLGRVMCAAAAESLITYITAGVFLIAAVGAALALARYASNAMRFDIAESVAPLPAPADTAGGAQSVAPDAVRTRPHL